MLSFFLNINLKGGSQMYTITQPFNVMGNSAVAVTTTPQSVNLGGATSYLHNAGTGHIYISATQTTPDNTCWDLASGEKLPFPVTGLINVVSDATATLKILVVDAYLN